MGKLKAHPDLKHEQDQADLAEDDDRHGGMLAEQCRRGGGEEAPEEGRAEEQSRQDLAHHSGLPQAPE